MDDSASVTTTGDLRRSAAARAGSSSPSTAASRRAPAPAAAATIAPGAARRRRNPGALPGLHVRELLRQRTPSLAAREDGRARVRGRVSRRSTPGSCSSGPSGRGKTHLACAILSELVADQGRHRALRRLLGSPHEDPDLASGPTPTSPRSRSCTPYAEAELLVLDELGASKPHPWVLDVLYNLLNTRYNRKKITIVTSNFEDEPEPRVGRARPARGPDRLPHPQPALRDVPAWSRCAATTSARTSWARRSDPAFETVARSGPLRLRRRPGLVRARPPRACARRPRAPSPRLPATPLPSRRAARRCPSPRSVRRAARRPADPAPSGVLSTASGSRATCRSSPSARRDRGGSWRPADRAELLRGPARPASAAGAGSGPPSFQVQAGAFSQEEPARELADRLAARVRQTPATVAFSADRGVYRVLLGGFPDAAGRRRVRREAQGRAARTALVAEGAPPAAARRRPPRPSSRSAARTAPARLAVARGRLRRSGADAPVVWDGKPYRGSLRVARQLRAALLERRQPRRPRGVPLRRRPRRDGAEALRRARGAEGAGRRRADLRARAPRPVRGGGLRPLRDARSARSTAALSAEDPLSTAAVDATRGLVARVRGPVRRRALRLDVRRRDGERRERLRRDARALPRVGVECGELATRGVRRARRSTARRRRARGRRSSGAATSSRATAAKGAARRAAEPRDRADAGRACRAAARRPATLDAVGRLSVAHRGLRPRGRAGAAPDRARRALLRRAARRRRRRSPGPAREAYEFLLRFRFGGGEPLPPPDRDARPRRSTPACSSRPRCGSPASPRAPAGSSRARARTSGSRPPEGRQGLPVDPELPLARRVGRPLSSRRVVADAARGRPPALVEAGAQRPGALGRDSTPAGPTFERESAWTEWVRRVPAKELARRMAGAGRGHRGPRDHGHEAQRLRAARSRCGS